jgi:hypothetical protein
VIDIQGLQLSRQMEQMPEPVKQALASYLLFDKIAGTMGDWVPGKKLQTKVFFVYLEKRGGTAIDFDWIRGHGYCELEDWEVFQDALDRVL